MSNPDLGQPALPPDARRRSLGQVLALIAAIVLLFPGLCFFGFGAGYVAEAEMGDLGWFLLAIGVGILAVVWLLFRISRHRR